MKFKVGDKVRVVKGHSEWYEYMNKYLGKVLTISANAKDRYYQAEESGMTVWYEDELEPFFPTRPCKSSRIENTYVVRTDNKSLVLVREVGNPACVGEAKCHPQDTFDIAEGFKIALRRMQRMTMPTIEDGYGVFVRDYDNENDGYYCHVVRGATGKLIATDYELALFDLEELSDSKYGNLGITKVWGRATDPREFWDKDRELLWSINV